MEPTINKNRIHLIDLIRGFALIGLPFVNVIALWHSHMNLSETVRDIWVQRFIYIFVEGRFYAIFSFLFGVGIFIFLSRAKAKNERPYIIFIRRMVILAVVGLIHQFFNPGEALLFYGILGLPLIFFEKIPKQVNLIIGILGVVIGSIFAAKLVLTVPLMLLGLAFGQYEVFERCRAYKKVWRIVFGLSFVATMILTVFLWKSAPELGEVNYLKGTELTEIQMESNADFYDFMKLCLTFGPFFSIFYISFLVVIEPFANKLLSPLNAFGRMAFTNYLGQTLLLLVIIMLIPSDVIVSYTFATITCAIVVIAQIIASAYWLRYFKYGPLEWLWRCGTYGKLLPIRK